MVVDRLYYNTEIASKGSENSVGRRNKSVGHNFRYAQQIFSGVGTDFSADHYLLNDASEGFTFSPEVLETTLQRIYRKECDVATEIELDAWREFWRCFNEATDKGFGVRSFNEDDYDFYRALRYNNGVFAAFRTHRFQNDVAAQLLDEDGRLKPFERFSYDVRRLIAPTHLRSWLQTEYSTAVIRARQAAQWLRFEANRDVLPNLRWVPSTSLHPGLDHQVFWNTIRPIDDPFWNLHRPGDRWNCKCDLEATDEPPTEDLPEATDADLPSAGLDNNPARDAKLFSDTHPYVRNAYEGAREAVERFVSTQTLDDERTFKEDVKRQRAEIRQWAKENLIGRNITIPGLGRQAAFTATGIKEALNQPHKHLLEKNEAVKAISGLLETGTYLRFDPDVKGNPMVKGYHYIEVEIGGEPSFVVIRELNDGSLAFYSIVDSLKKKE